MIPLFHVLCALHTAATASPDAVAAFREGSVSRAELGSWRRFLGRSQAATEGEALRRDVEGLVVLRVLAASAERQGLLETRDARAELRQLARELASSALRAHWRETSVPSEAEVRAEYEAGRATYEKPRRWMLRNILLRVPPGADREEVRRRAGELRSQAAAGADFGALAEAHSESATRAHQGRIGWVTLDRLEPRAAEAVAQLDAGGLTPVIETAEGFTILRCTAVIPAGVTPFEEVRERLQSTLAAKQIAERRERLLAEIRAGTALEPAPPGSRAGDADAPLLVYRGRGGAYQTLSVAEYRVFLRSRDLDPDAEVTEQDRGHRHDELRIELGLEDEARRVGLLDTPEYQERWSWEKLRAAAHEAFAVKARKAPPITDEQVAAHYDAHRERFVQPEGFRLSAIEVLLDRDTPRAVVERARGAADALGRGALAWSQAAASIDPSGAHARMRDLGWMKREEFFHLGAAAQAAAEGLRPGASSGLLQEGRKLMILRMEEQRPPRPLPLAEAAERIRKEIVRERNREAQDAMTAEILAAQQIVLLADSKLTP